MAEYVNYAITQYKPQEQPDDGFMNSASPASEPTSSPLGNKQRLAIKAAGVYVGAQIYSNVSSNVKDLTGSSALQSKIDTGAYIVGAVVATIATGGWYLVYEGAKLGIEYSVRNKVNIIENQARQEERKFLGKHITNSMGAAYYD